MKQAGLMVLMTLMGQCIMAAEPTTRRIDSYELNYDSPVDATLQSKVEALDKKLREKLEMTAQQTAAGLLDLNTLCLAMINPDREEYAASVPKIGILLAYFELNPQAATELDPTTQHELGLMIKVSDNAMAAKFSRQLGLKEIQKVLDKFHFYDASHGGGIWVGKHYGKDAERYGSPIADNSHAATVRQLLRYYLLLEQGKLVSPAASEKMREIFESPDIPHAQIKFVKALSHPDLKIIRKSGTWQNWLHDSAVITGPGRHYILVALTKHPKGDEYLEQLAREVDDLMQRQ
jgi:beta-lactamase class A